MPIRPSDLAAVLGALAAGGLVSACKSSPEVVEVPTQAPGSGEASCRHELGRCGGHKPGDGACGAGPRSKGSAPEQDVPQDMFSGVAVEPGKFAEINLEMARGSTVTAAFTSSGPVAWNVHSHAGEAVAVHAEGTSTGETIRFVADRAGGFSLLWQNKGTAAVTLDVTLRTEGSVTLHSTHPARAPSQE